MIMVVMRNLKLVVHNASAEAYDRLPHDPRASISHHDMGNSRYKRTANQAVNTFDSRQQRSSASSALLTSLYVCLESKSH